MNSRDNSPIILWFRKDLRLDDNLAFACAAESLRPVVPVYILEPDVAGNGPLGAAQAWWLHHSLKALSASLAKIGSRLVLRRGPADAVLGDLVAETGASHVFWNRRYDPPGIAIDTPIKEELTRSGLTVRSFAGQLLHEPSRLKTGAGGPYRVYTPFWRALEASGEPVEPVPAPERLVPPTDWPASERIDSWMLTPTRPDWAAAFSSVWTPGEAGAAERLERFVDRGLDGYKSKRDCPALPHTSGLSPHLALGEISPARVWHATHGLPDAIAAEDVIHFRKELAWRDFSYHLLFHFPDLATKNWNAKFDAFPWRHAPDDLKRWQRGQTGYPIVDAGMRQLWRHRHHAQPRAHDRRLLPDQEPDARLARRANAGSATRWSMPIRLPMRRAGSGWRDRVRMPRPSSASSIRSAQGEKFDRQRRLCPQLRARAEGLAEQASSTGRSEAPLHGPRCKPT